MQVRPPMASTECTPISLASSIHSLSLSPEALDSAQRASLLYLPCDLLGVTRGDMHCHRGAKGDQPPPPRVRREHDRRMVLDTAMAVRPFGGKGRRDIELHLLAQRLRPHLDRAEALRARQRECFGDNQQFEEHSKHSVEAEGESAASNLYHSAFGITAKQRESARAHSADGLWELIAQRIARRGYAETASCPIGFGRATPLHSRCFRGAQNMGHSAYVYDGRFLRECPCTACLYGQIWHSIPFIFGDSEFKQKLDLKTISISILAAGRSECVLYDLPSSGRSYTAR